MYCNALLVSLVVTCRRYLTLNCISGALSMLSPSLVCQPMVLKDVFFCRKYTDKMQQPVYYSPHVLDGDGELNTSE
jgi:hypothetical protein